MKEQIEGAVAARYPVPQGGRGNPRLKNVEVAWDNLLEGRVMRARITDAGPLRPGDYVSDSGRAQQARPDLLSIGSGGLFDADDVRGAISMDLKANENLLYIVGETRNELGGSHLYLRNGRQFHFFPSFIANQHHRSIRRQVSLAPDRLYLGYPTVPRAFPQLGWCVGSFRRRAALRLHRLAPPLGDAPYTAPRYGPTHRIGVGFRC